MSVYSPAEVHSTGMPLTLASMSWRSIPGSHARPPGARTGDRVGLALPPGRAFVVAVHACLLLRAAAMPVDLRLAERERKELLRGVDVMLGDPLAEDGGAPFNVTEPD